MVAEAVDTTASAIAPEVPLATVVVEAAAEAAVESAALPEQAAAASTTAARAAATDRRIPEESGLAFISVPSLGPPGSGRRGSVFDEGMVSPGCEATVRSV